MCVHDPPAIGQNQATGRDEQMPTPAECLGIDVVVPMLARPPDEPAILLVDDVPNVRRSSQPQKVHWFTPIEA